MIALRALSLVLALAVLVPIVVLAVECFVAALLGRPRRRAPADAGPRPRTVVLVPAHDEEEGLPRALGSLEGQLGPEDRVLVVAHNCSDGTARIAREHRVDVAEVNDDGTRGKPAALEAGLAALDASRPEVVAILDADCEARPGAIEALARRAHESGGPVQGIYVFDDGRGGARSVSSLALLVKNLIRPLGLFRLGAPCLLNGSGSAYPFELLRDAPQGKGSIAEDYQLAVDLALAGKPPRFVPEAEVRTRLPGERRSAYRQRTRWEHGHLQLVFRTAPRLALAGLVRGRPALLALAADLAVPPLAFLALAWGASAALATATWLAGGGALAARVAAGSGILLAAAVLAGWIRFLGLGPTLAALARVPAYVAWKVPLYFAYFRDREKRWTKTPRDAA